MEIAQQRKSRRIGKELRKRREFLQLSLREIGVRCGCSHVTIWEYEKGHALNAVTLVRICLELGLSIEELIR